MGKKKPDKNLMDQIVSYLDVNKNGKIDIEDIIIMGLRVPGIRIEREAFLRKEFSRHYDEKTINKIIKTNPMQAGIGLSEVNKIATDVIQYERNCVSGIAAALGAPGGFAMIATIPADIAQYYGYLLRAIQKLLYLYGFPELDIEDENGVQIDSATMNIITICFGVMYGVAGANKALRAIGTALGKGIKKQLLNAPLTKGVVYPIVKKVANWFGIKMTKEVFAGFFEKAVPIFGGIIGGTITYVSFKPCCDRLKNELADTKLSNPKFKESADELIIDVEGKEIEDLLIEESADNI